MDFFDLKLDNLGLRDPALGRIVAFVDYGNVDHWFDKDERLADGSKRKENQKLFVDVGKLAQFAASFCTEKRFYYGWNPRNKTNWHIAIKAEKCGFIKITKPMQFIRHDVPEAVTARDGRTARRDHLGKFIEIPKSNFDVEISVDALRILDRYDTFCLFSGDSDFAYLARFLKRKSKKIIIFAAGQVFHTLKEAADLYINAQEIKAHIVGIKETTPLAGRGLDIGSASGGQGGLPLDI